MRTSSDLTDLWRTMMGSGGFGTRSIWHVFLEHDGRLNRLVVPIDDVPLVPDPQLVGNLARIMREVMSDSAGGSIAVLLSRPGPGHMTADDRSWARVIREAYGPALCPWPIHLATHGCVRVFAPDDLIAA